MTNLPTVFTITRTTLSALLFTAVPTAYANDPQPDAWTGNVNAYLGHKNVGDKDWPNLDSQGSIGVIPDFKKESCPVSIAADLIVSGTENNSGINKTTGACAEIHLGVRKIFTFQSSSFKPYTGGGVALISAVLEKKTAGVNVDDDDSPLSAWVGVDGYYAVAKNISLGLDVRYSNAAVTLFN